MPSVSAIIKEMVKEDRFKSFAVFATGKSVNDYVMEIGRDTLKQPNKLDIYKFETLLDELLPLLQLATALSNDAKDLQSSATRRLLDYWQFRNTSLQLIELEKNGVDKRDFPILMKSYEDAASAFQQSDTPLTNGLGKVFAGRGLSLETEKKAADTAHSLIDTKWEALNKYQSELQDRHDRAGDGLNYAERYQLLSEHHLKPVVAAILNIARVVEAALEIFYREVHNLPHDGSGHYLEDLITWAYNAKSLLQEMRHNEVRTLLTDTHYSPGQDAKFEGEFHFNTDDRDQSVLTNPRIERAELVLSAISDIASSAGAICQIAVQPPKQQRRYSLKPDDQVAFDFPIRGAVFHRNGLRNTVFDFSSDVYLFEPNAPWKVKINKKRFNNDASDFHVSLRLWVKGTPKLVKVQ